MVYSRLLLFFGCCQIRQRFPPKFLGGLDGASLLQKFIGLLGALDRFPHGFILFRNEGSLAFLSLFWAIYQCMVLESQKFS